MADDHLSDKFHPADYAVMAVMLALSVGIGLYFSVAKGGQKSPEDFLMAGRSMRFLPIAISVLASFFSASTLLGTPAEIYEYGTQYWISVFTSALAPLTGALLFGPMFFRLKIVSVFQYLEMRYRSQTVRLFGSGLFIIRATIGMGIVLYGPCTALNAVTTFPVWGSILIVGIVCTAYTFLGGLKAVIWTDVLQTLIMVAGMLAVLIQGVIELGGMKKVWDIAETGGRIEFFNFDTDPTVRHTFWTLVIGIYFVWLPPYTVDQQMVQRFSSARSLRDAKIALLCNIPGMFFLITLCSLVGVVLYAAYADCDPLQTKVISNANQLLPLYVLRVLSFAPGLPGLLFASLFSGSLSSVSSMLNSLAAVTWEDFLKLRFKGFSARKVTWVNRGLVVVFGGLGIAMAFLVEKLGGTVLQASLTFNGAAGAPLVGIFILGAFFPCANWIGAISGGTFGFCLSMWLGLGKYITKPLDFKLPTSISGCPSNTSVFSYLNHTEDHVTSVFSYLNKTANQVYLQNSTVVTHHNLTLTEKLYSVSYLWLSVIGTLGCVVVGLTVSLLSGGCKREDISDDLLLTIIPRCVRRRHRNGQISGNTNKYRPEETNLTHYTRTQQEDDTHQDNTSGQNRFVDDTNNKYEQQTNSL